MKPRWIAKRHFAWLWPMTWSFGQRRALLRMLCWWDTDPFGVGVSNAIYWSRPDRWKLWFEVRYLVKLHRRGIAVLHA